MSQLRAPRAGVGARPVPMSNVVIPPPSRPARFSSFEQYEQLVAVEDDDQEEGEDDEEDEEEEDEEEPEAEAEPEEDLGDANLDFASSLYPSLFTDGHMAPLEDDFLFPVHMMHDAVDEEDEVLFADSGANTPLHTSRRMGRGGYAPMPPMPQTDPNMWAPEPPMPAQPAYATPSPRSSSSLRRHSQLGSLAHQANPSMEASLNSSLSRPMSADIERRRVERSPSGTFNSPPPAFPSSAASPAPSRSRQPFHQFGNGPVSTKPNGSPISPPGMSALPSLLPPVSRQRSIPPAAGSPQITPRPASPRFNPAGLVQSKNSFPSRPPAHSVSPPHAPFAVAGPPHPQRQVIPDRSLFPDFPSMQPTPLPGAFSSAPSQPLSVVSIPGSNGTAAMFELPAGYEIVRKLPASSQPSSGRGGPDSHRKTPRGGAEDPKQSGAPSSNPFLSRAMADILQQMASKYGLARPASAMIIEDDSTPRRPRLHVDDGDIAEASISFTDVDAISRPSTPSRARKEAHASVTFALPSSSSDVAEPSADAPSFKEKVRGMSSFIQDVFDEIECEGGTPRASRTPADSMKFDVHEHVELQEFVPQQPTTSKPRPQAVILPTTTAFDVVNLSETNSLEPENQLIPLMEPSSSPVSSASSSNAQSPAAMPPSERVRPSLPVSASVPFGPGSAILNPIKQKAWGTKGKGFIEAALTEKEASTSAPAASRSKRAPSRKAATSLITAQLTVHPLLSPSTHKGSFKPSSSASIKESYNSGPTSSRSKKPSGSSSTSTNTSHSNITSISESSAKERDSSSSGNLSTKDSVTSGGSSSGSGSVSVSASGTGSLKPKKKLRKKSSKLKRLKPAPRGTHLVKTIPSAPIRCLTVVKDEVWTCEKDGVLVIRDAVTGNPVEKGARFYLPSSIVTSLVYAAGCVWAGTDAGKLLRIDPETRHVHPPDSAARSFTSGINILAFNGQRRIFAGSQDHILRSWDAQTGAYLRTFTGHTRDIRALLCMGFTQVWSASADATIRIFNVESGECLQVLQGHTDAVTCLVAVGATVISGSADGSLKVWKWSGSGQGSAEATQAAAIPGVHVPPPHADSSSSLISQWECMQTVACDVGRIASVLLVSSNQLWSVGQSDRIGVWSVASGSGLVTRLKELAPEGGHSSFISGVSAIRRTEAKSIWSFSTSTSGADESDKLCLWTHVTHNGKDPAEQLQQARNMNLTVRSHFQHLQRAYQRLRHQLQHERGAFQQELQRMLLLAAEHRSQTLREQDAGRILTNKLASRAEKCTELTDALDAIRDEAEQLRQKVAALEVQKLEQIELHEEYSLNLKKVLADSTKRREQLETDFESLSRDNQRLDQRAEYEEHRANQAEERTLAAEAHAAELEQLVSSLRAEALDAQEAAARDREAMEREAARARELASGSSASLAARLAALESENASLQRRLGADDPSRTDQLARELHTLHTTLDRLKRNVIENVAKPLRGLTAASLFKVQSEVSTAALNVQQDVTDSARLIATIMHTHLTPDQRLHVGMSAGTAVRSNNVDNLSPAERDQRQLQYAVELSLRDQ